MTGEHQVLGGSTDVLSTEQMGMGLKYPVRGHRFVVTVGNLGLVSFKSVDGFNIETSPVEYREGAFGTLAARKLPGLVTYGEITLTKGIYQNRALYNYFMGYISGSVTAVQQMTIEAYDNADTVAAKWNVKNVWPYHYDSTGLNADSPDILVETVTFAHEGISREI